MKNNYVPMKELLEKAYNDKKCLYDCSECDWDKKINNICLCDRLYDIIFKDEANK